MKMKRYCWLIMFLFVLFMTSCKAAEIQSSVTYSELMYETGETITLSDTDLTVMVDNETITDFTVNILGTNIYYDAGDYQVEIEIILPDETSITTVVTVTIVDYPLSDILMILGIGEHIHIIGEDDVDLMDGVSAIDRTYGDLTANIIVDDSDVDYETIGVYVIYYTVQNADGYSRRETSTVTVRLFDVPETFPEEFAIVYYGGLYGVVDIDDNELIPCDYNDISYLEEGIIELEKAGSLFYFNLYTGAFIEFDGMPNGFTEGRSVFVLDGRYGILSIDNEIIAPNIYSFAKLRDIEGYAQVRSGDYYGYVDSSGEEVIEPRFISMTDLLPKNDFENTLFLVRFIDLSYGIIDSNNDVAYYLTNSTILKYEIDENTYYGIYTADGLITVDDSFAKETFSIETDSLQIVEIDDSGLMIVCDSNGSYYLLDKNKNTLLSDIPFASFADLSYDESKEVYVFLNNENVYVYDTSFVLVKEYDNSLDLNPADITNIDTENLRYQITGNHTFQVLYDSSGNTVSLVRYDDIYIYDDFVVLYDELAFDIVFVDRQFSYIYDEIEGTGIFEPDYFVVNNAASTTASIYSDTGALIKSGLNLVIENILKAQHGIYIINQGETNVYLYDQVEDNLVLIDTVQGYLNFINGIYYSFYCESQTVLYSYAGGVLTKINAYDIAQGGMPEAIDLGYGYYVVPSSDDLYYVTTPAIDTEYDIWIFPLSEDFYLEGSSNQISLKNRNTITLDTYNFTNSYDDYPGSFENIVKIEISPTEYLVRLQSLLGYYYWFFLSDTSIASVDLTEFQEDDRIAFVNTDNDYWYVYSYNQSTLIYELSDQATFFSIIEYEDLYLITDGNTHIVRINGDDEFEYIYTTSNSIVDLHTHADYLAVQEETDKVILYENSLGQTEKIMTIVDTLATFEINGEILLGDHVISFDGNTYLIDGVTKDYPSIYFDSSTDILYGIDEDGIDAYFAGSCVMTANTNVMSLTSGFYYCYESGNISLYDGTDLLFTIDADEIEYIEDADSFMVKNDGTYGIIDMTGDYVISNDYISIAFNDTYYIVTGSCYYGVYDENGNELIDTHYDDLWIYIVLEEQD